jgi:hypothetical protein
MPVWFRINPGQNFFLTFQLFKMKAIKCFLLGIITILAIQSVNAQGSTLYLKKSDNKLLYYGRTGTVTTTDATPTNIDLMTISSNEGGVIEVIVVGYSTTDSSVVTGSKIVRYVKKGGTLTLGTATAVLAVAADTGISTATFAFAASSNNIVVQVTGVAGKTIKWKAISRRVISKLSD